MTKKYLIRGKEIIVTDNTMIDIHFNLLEALNEEKEECPACRVENYGVEAVHSKHTCRKEEPKSTLKEEISEYVNNHAYVPNLDPDRTADKIISLFKDTLLKEIKNEIIVFGGCSSCDKCECQMKYKDAIKDTKQEITNLIKNI